MTSRGGALAVVVVHLATGPAYARPETQRVSLRYSAPTECPDDLELVQAVEDYLGQSLRDARRQSLAIDVRTQGDEARGYSTKLSFVGADGTQERYADHPDCGKLIEAAALMVAIAIDPERVKARQGVEPKSEAAVPPDAVPPTRTAPMPEPAVAAPAPAPAPTRDRGAEPVEPPSNGRAQSPSVALLALTSHGTLPSIAPGLGVDLGLRLGSFEAAVAGRYWASRDGSVPRASAASVEVSLIAVGLRLCQVPELGHWSVALCARGDLGDMEGTGQGVANARTRHALFATLGGDVALSYTRHRLVPLAGLDLHWAAARPRFGVLRDGSEVEAFRPDAWGATGFVGLSYRL